MYSRSRANPYAHTSSRCQAFLALLQVFGKVAPEVKNTLLLRSYFCSVTFSIICFSSVHLLSASLPYQYNREAQYPHSITSNSTSTPPLTQATLYKDKEKGGGPGSEELLLQAYVEFMMDEEVPLDNIALRVDPLRTTVPVAGLRHMGRDNRDVEAAVYQDSNASQASKRHSVNSNTDEGIAQVKQVFKREIRIDSELQSSHKPPLPNRNSMRLAPPPYEDSDCPQSVLSPNNLINAYPASPRTSLRLDQSTLETNISLMSVSSVVRESGTRPKVGNRLN